MSTARSPPVFIFYFVICKLISYFKINSISPHIFLKQHLFLRDKFYFLFGNFFLSDQSDRVKGGNHSHHELCSGLSVKVPWEPFKASGNCASLHSGITKADLGNVNALDHIYSYAYYFPVQK